MPKPSDDTRIAIFALQGRPTDRGRCAALGLPPSWRGTLNRIANNFPVSLDKENEVRRRIGLPPVMPPLIPVPACPDCGSVHHARCNGHAGPVVVLAAGESVRHVAQRPRRARKAMWRACLPAELTPDERAQVRQFAASLLRRRS